MNGKRRPELLKEIERLERRIREIEARGGSPGNGERIAGEERCRTIVQTSLDGFWINDMEGRIVDANEAYCRLIGYSRDELLQMRIPDVEAVEKPEETARHIKKILDEGYDRFETRHRCKDGAIIDIEISATYLDVGGGASWSYSFATSPIARRRKKNSTRTATNSNHLSRHAR